MSVLQSRVSSLQDLQCTAAKATSGPRVAHFGPFEVNFLSRELRNHGLRVKLPEKPLQILEALLQRAGEVVRRDELQKKLWPDTFVGYDRCLNTAVSSLRRALGDAADNPRFIETRYRWGYRFVAPLEAGEACDKVDGNSEENQKDRRASYSAGAHGSRVNDFH